MVRRSQGDAWPYALTAWPRMPSARAGERNHGAVVNQPIPAMRVASAGVMPASWAGAGADRAGAAARGRVREGEDEDGPRAQAPGVLGAGVVVGGRRLVRHGLRGLVAIGGSSGQNGFSGFLVSHRTYRCRSDCACAATGQPLSVIENRPDTLA
ncbi:hypothetical protein GCM10017750_26500 [Streptomyces racemochromogenes]